MTFDLTRPESTRARFLTLLRTDLCACGSAWLHREFDAIIAANFGEPGESRRTPPPRTRTGRDRARRSAPTPHGEYATSRLAHQHWPVEAPARQRSPPE